MLSYGRQQSAKLMFVVGEQGRGDNVAPDGIIEPNRAGIFLGNNALDAVYDDNVAFYWKRNTTSSDFSRIQVRNKQFGSSGEPHSADPNNGRTALDEDVFLCPTSESDNDKGFSYAFSPLQRFTKKFVCASKNIFLLLLNCSAWGCQGPAWQKLQDF